MEELSVRLLPDTANDGAAHMAADEVLLRTASAGLASLRFYAWQRPTLSLGYFQPEAGRQEDPLLADLSFVRRPSGGLALVHHHEQTYALAVPAARSWKDSRGWLRMHEVIAAALAEFGVTAQQQLARDDDSTNYLCFHHLTAGDLVLAGAKIAGSAQRKQHGGLLQHGSILLARSPFTPSLPGILELRGVDVKASELREAIVAQTRRLLGWNLVLGGWTREETAAIAEVTASRYRADSWNRKR